VPRDRRWDHLYDRQPQPVKEVVLERFAEDVGRQLAAWPPPFAEWVPGELLARWSAGLGERPRDAVLRVALTLARLDLERDHDAMTRLLEGEGARSLKSRAEEQATHLVARYLTERCLALKDEAAGARLTRSDLARALHSAERRLFLLRDR
jgi:hypothetical protein